VEARKEALGHLFERYAKPVYHYIRIKWSKSPEDARELTQDFFIAVLEGEALKRYEPGRASFRTYLKGILRNIAADQFDAARAKKRGGGLKVIPIPDALEDSLADSGTRDPEVALDWAWRVTVLDRAVERARDWFRSQGREAQFRTFQEAVLGQPDDRPTDREVASRLGLTETTVGNHINQVRERLRIEIRAELTHTVLDRDQLEDEYRLIIGETGI
jgi:RNA polymerase sigma-70 factor (ECF subfamily)